MVTNLFLALACTAGTLTGQVARRPVTVDQLPQAPRQTFERMSKGRTPTKLAEVETPRGCVYYEGVVHRPFRYDWDVAVDSSGRVLGNWTTERSGTGP